MLVKFGVVRTPCPPPPNAWQGLISWPLAPACQPHVQLHMCWCCYSSKTACKCVLFVLVLVSNCIQLPGFIWKYWPGSGCRHRPPMATSPLLSLPTPTHPQKCIHPHSPILAHALARASLACTRTRLAGQTRAASMVTLRTVSTGGATLAVRCSSSTRRI